MHFQTLTLPSFNEINIRYVYLQTDNEEGKDKTIVIIPGFFGTIEERYPLAQAFSKYYNVILYEPRGYGKSSKLHVKGIYDISSYANEMREIFQVLNLQSQQFTIFGSSLAVSMIHQYSVFLEGEKPEPAALLLASPAPKYREAGIFKRIGWFPDWLFSLFQKIVFLWLKITRNKKERNDVKNAEKRFYDNDPWVQRRIAIESLGAVDFRGQEGTIPYPLYIMSSINDDFTDPKDAKRYLVGNPLSEHKLFEHDSHKFIEGKEEALVEHINSFLSSKIWKKELHEIVH